MPRQLPGEADHVAGIASRTKRADRRERARSSQTIVLPPRWEPIPPSVLSGEEWKGKFYVSVNELNSFQRCRRAWDLTSASRQSLHRKGNPDPALHMGSCVHYACAVHTLGGDPLVAVNRFYMATVAELEKQSRERFNTPLTNEEKYLLQAQMLDVRALIAAYFDRYGTTNPVKPYMIIAPEVTFEIPLVPDQDIYLVGTIDRVMMDEFGNPIPGEIKTYKSAPKRENWRFNHQLYGYAAALQALTGKRVPVATYDGIRKKAPTQPAVLKSGRLSKQWIDTTHKVYRDALLRTFGGEIPNDYLELLSRFKARDRSADSVFNTRFRIPIVQHALERWWDSAVTLAMEMANYPIIRPNFEWQGCPMCKVKDLCYAIEAGDDQMVKWLKQDQYGLGQTHTRQASRVVRPGDINSVEDFADWAGGMAVDKPFEVAPGAIGDEA